MVTDTKHACRLTMREAGELVGVHYNTVRRWHVRGIRGELLRCFFVGGRLFTSQANLIEFQDRVTVKIRGDVEAARAAMEKEPDHDDEVTHDLRHRFGMPV